MGIGGRGPSNPNWRGGRSVASNGYVLVRVGVEHHLADVRGYAYEHRVNAELKIGRRLRKGERVHHRDEDKTNNAPDNLEVLTAAQHGAAHRIVHSSKRMPGERNPMVRCLCGCDQKFKRFDSSNRRRHFVSGHNLHKAL